MKAINVIIGDEILLGQVTDTNSGVIARAIAPIGWEILRTVTVGDDGEAIRRAVEESLADADLVITTGGLGPTKDDITKNIMAKMTGSRLTLHTPSLVNIERIMSCRGLETNELTRSQALVPESCEPIINRCGTAPIMWFDIEDKILISLPGVPFEMQTSLELDIVPRLKERFPDESATVHRVILLSDISESAVSELISDWEDSLPAGFHLAYLPNIGYLRLRLDGHGADHHVLESTADRLAAELADMLSGHVWLTDDRTPAEALLQWLIDHNMTVSTAESCTGGNICARLTAIPGSSAAVAGGAVVYCNQAKEEILGVKRDTLMSHGAVSEPTVAEMASGTRRVYHSSLGIATSGIAGPGGAVPGKPVGTVCVGLSLGEVTRTMTLHLPGSRTRVIDRAVNTALIEALRLCRKEFADNENNL